MTPARRIWQAALVLALAATVAAPAAAQERLQLPSPILTVDQEALYNGSAVAEMISDEIAKRGEALAAENRDIEVRLVAEELELTEMRPSMAPDEFRVLADAFDAKVQTLREKQDAKTRELQKLREQERQNFLRRISPILGEIVRERGAVVVLDRRAVFLSADTIDITQEAIDRINRAFEANGSDGTLTPPAPETPAPENSIPKGVVPAPDAPTPEPPAQP